MKDDRHEAPAGAAMRRLLEAAYVGTSPAVTRMRDQIVEFCTAPMARVVFLEGPSGIGKSTVARHIAFGKAHGLVGEEALEPLRSENVRYGGPNLIDHRMMAEWFVELPLTGLVESLAEAQLFGVARGAYSDAVERPGVFELASQNEEILAVKLTGGVVFLDEVGELTPKLQAKLLPVLSNGVFYRVGGEGIPSYQVQYRGVVITASWRRLDSVLRADLVSRLTTHVIEVPGLEQRAEDLPLIIEALVQGSRDRFTHAVERLLQADPAVASGHLQKLRERLAAPTVDCVAKLCAIDWSKHGQLRGLANAIEKIVLQGRTTDDVVASLPRLPEPRTNVSLIEELLEGPAASLAEAVRDIEARARDELRRRVFEEPILRTRLAEHFGITETELRKQIANLARDRRVR